MKRRDALITEGPYGEEFLNFLDGIKKTASYYVAANTLSDRKEALRILLAYAFEAGIKTAHHTEMSPPLKYFEEEGEWYE